MLLNFASRLKEANLASINCIGDFVKKIDFNKQRKDIKKKLL